MATLLLEKILFVSIVSYIRLLGALQNTSKIHIFLIVAPKLLQKSFKDHCDSFIHPHPPAPSQQS
jgi:hypothetical protein